MFVFWQLSGTKLYISMWQLCSTAKTKRFTFTVQARTLFWKGHGLSLKHLAEQNYRTIPGRRKFAERLEILSWKPAEEPSDVLIPLQRWSSRLLQGMGLKKLYPSTFPISRYTKIFNKLFFLSCYLSFKAYCWNDQFCFPAPCNTE